MRRRRKCLRLFLFHSEVAMARLLSEENADRLRGAMESMKEILGLLEDDPEPVEESVEAEEPVTEAVLLEVNLTEYAPLTSRE